MNKHLISAIIILMTLSLVGIIGFQLFWINHALQLKEEQFDRKVEDALKKVVEKLETQEAVNVITNQFNTIKLNQDIAQLTKKALPNPATRPRIKIKPTPVKANTKHAETAASEKNTPSGILFYPAMRHLDSTTLNRLTRVKYFVDTVKLHNHVKQRMVWVRADSSIRPVNRLDSMRRTVFSQNRSFRPTPTEPLPVQQIKIDTARVKGFRIAADNLVILNNLNQASINFFSEKEENSIHFQRLPEAASQVIAGGKTLPATVGSISASPHITAAIKPMVRPGQPVLLRPSQNPEAAVKTADQQKKVKAKTNQLTEVVQKMAVEYVRKSLPLEKRLPKPKLDSLVKNELWQAGIHLPYTYAVKKEKHGQQIPVRNTSYRPASAEGQYTARLFPNDIYIEPNYLTLQFPDRNAYLLHSFRYLMGFSALFTLIMLSTFLVTVYTILKQKKISEIKNDFINNMTHEFKTPLATISLAVDAIANPKILQNQERIIKYAGIIRDENKRMHKQVEDVLQIALLDKQELKLNRQPLPLQPLVQQVVQNMQLLLESKSGLIKLSLEASEAVVLADEAHLGNALGNLLDNAIKYSPGAPEITVRTTFCPDAVLLTVTDLGMGMSRETQHRIFDKFYRVSTGNLHPVKGFGLGLAYVKAIVQGHQGSIKVKSELGRGSSFEIKLPLAKI